MSDIQIIVARYNEDVSWVRDLKLPILIYNKGDTPTGVESTHTVISRPNHGREAETYLHYLVEHYDALPEKLVFLQGNPFDHCPSLFPILDNPPQIDRFIPLGHNFKRESLAQGYNWDGFQRSLHQLATIIGVAPDATVRYVTGAQFMVPKEVVLRRSKVFYEALQALLSVSEHPHEAWGMERLWGYVFGEKYETDDLCLDLVMLGGPNPSLTEAVTYLKKKHPDMTIGYLTRERAFLDGSDYVAFVATSETFTETALYDLVEGYYSTKMGLPGEADPVMIEPPKIFMTHRGVLLQHSPVLSDMKKLEIERKVPFFRPATSLFETRQLRNFSALL